MRKVQFIPNSYYHICNRSNDESTIFFDEKDYSRFLFSVLFYQSPIPFYNLGRQSSYFVKHLMFNISSDTLKKVISTRKVELNIFTIMPNHFHLLIQEKTKSGISSYLQRLQNGYAKYFNTKYAKRGHLFQGAFRAVPVETDEQLLYLSTYIHRNPRELKEWKNKEAKYPWSSYQDLVDKNRWGELLKPNIILDQFSGGKDYHKFVETSTAKLQPSESSIKNIFLE
ncbi:MAG: transposase [Patescibacteria group bacterium]